MKIRIDYAAANRAAYAEYHEIINACPWMKCRETINVCLRKAFAAARAEAAAAAAPNASEAWESMTPAAQYDYLLHAAYLLPRRAETHSRRDPVTGERVAAPSPIAGWIGKEEAHEDAFRLIAAESYLSLPRYLERADDENRPLSWAVARATWTACSHLYNFYRPAGGRKLRAAGEEVEARLTAPRNASPDAAALDRAELEDVTGEPGAAAAVIEALDTLPRNASQSAAAAHIAAAAPEARNTVIIAAAAAGVEQKHIAAALDTTQQAVSYRFRKMRAAGEEKRGETRNDERRREASYTAAWLNGDNLQPRATITTTANSAAPAPNSPAAPADMYRHSLPAPEAPEDAARRRRRAAAIAAHNAHALSVTAHRAVEAAPDSAARKEARAIAKAATEEAERAAAIARAVAKAAR